MGFIDDRYGGAVDQYGRPVQIQQQYGMSSIDNLMNIHHVHHKKINEYSS
jgi:hypothetical protein